MKRILAAIDNSAAAHPVLEAAALIGLVFEATVDALHVREDGDEAVRAAASAVGLPLREVAGPVPARLVSEAAAPDVAAVVIGSRGTPGGRRPVGHVALALITSIDKPVVAVPPDATLSERLRRVVVPLDREPATARSVEGFTRMACRHALDVVVLHVHQEGSLPPFSDQPEYDTQAWIDEFVARYCPRLPVRAEVRLGLPGSEIVEFASGAGADLVVLAWGQDLSAGRGSTVREVLERCRVPVVLLPSRAIAPRAPSTTRRASRAAQLPRRRSRVEPPS